MKQVQKTVKRQTLGIYIGKAAPDAMRPRLGPGSARPGPRSVLYINDYILFFITIYVRSTYSACIHTQSVLHTYDGSGDLFSSTYSSYRATESAAQRMGRGPDN